MSTSQHSQISMVPGIGRRENPEQSDAGYEPTIGLKAVAKILNCSAEPGRRQGWVRTNRLAYPTSHLPGVAWGQWRNPHSSEGTDEACVRSDHAKYVWWRDDGLDAGSSWESGEAGDGGLMDASGRQPIG